MAKKQVSPETVEEALKVAKATVRPGQTKAQTKIIAQGIEKGIAEYKKREKAKARERDKERKKKLNAVVDVDVVVAEPETVAMARWVVVLPWVLLVVSWVGFAFVMLR